LNIYLRDLAIENYPESEHSCGLQALFRADQVTWLEVLW
jgi:hypothetical protein